MRETEIIVASKQGITIVGGATVSGADLALALDRAPILVAADGGGDSALRLGRRPVATIGDLDSLSPAARNALAPDVHRIEDQDSTDFDKVMARVAAPVAIGVGFLGGRLDHELAACLGLARHPDQPCLLLGAESVVCLVPPDLALDLAPGTPVSLIPLTRLRCQSDGLRWPLDALTLDPLGPPASSNEATGPVRLKPDAPALLLILPRAALDAALDALRASPRWPPAAPAR